MTSQRAQSVDASGPPILVVDDEPAIRALFTRVLQSAGYPTLEAADGVEALKVLDRAEVALVLLDSTMPRLDGQGVIAAIRANPATRTLPVILVTARASLGDRIEGLDAGADDYLPKPVSLDELLARVAAQLRSHRAWETAFAAEAAQRRALTVALRSIGDGSPPEQTATQLAEAAVSALGLKGLAIIVDDPDGRLVPLGVAGRWLGRLRPGHPIDRALAGEFRRLISRGPYAHARETDPAITTSGILVLPLEGPDGRFGLVGLRDASDPRDMRVLARRMPLFLEFADLAAAVLRPGLEAGVGDREERSRMQSIIDAAAFTPHFQPIVILGSGTIVGFESLTRFADGVQPDIRFAEARRLGLGSPLERATLTAALVAARALDEDAFLALNVSPALVLSTPDFPALLEGSGREIVIEITEHDAIEDYAAVRTALAGFGPRVRVAVDDAGSGYASLRHILALRPAFVKLDISWVHELDADPARQALIAGLVHFAAEIGCELIGEGVETEAEAATLQRLGVMLGQGYLLGRPMPAPGWPPSVSASLARAGASAQG